MRNHNRVILIILTVCCIAVAAAMVALHGQGKSDSSNKKQQTSAYDDSQLPVVDYDAPDPIDSERRRDRQAKGKKHNRRMTAVDPAIVQTVETYHWESGLPSIPVAKSDAVIVGKVTDAQAHLSSDKTGVYSEFTIQINQALKNDNHISLMPNTSIVVEREGGRVHYSSGHISRLYVSGLGMPRVGSKYIFFLTHSFLQGQLEEQDFHILTGYELRGGQVFPLDRSGVVDFDAHKNEDEITFLNEVQDAIKSAS